MTTITQYRGRTGLAISLIAALALAIPVHGAQAASTSTPGVLPPASKPYGLTYAQWSARWWQWAFSIPGSVNPLFDTTGEQCGQGQSGPVWFLAGLFFAPPTLPNTADRTCTVPAGKALFFPVANNECDSTPPPATPAQCRPFLVSQATYTNLAVEVDGTAISGLNTTGCPTASPSGDAFIQAQPSYCVGSDPFLFTMPQDNIYTALADRGLGAPVDAGTYTGLTIGVYLMLAPLSAGQHKVHIHAFAPAPAGMDVTYHLTVGS
jgi:hypothetical protein